MGDDGARSAAMTGPRQAPGKRRATADALVAQVAAAAASLPERARASWLVPRTTPDRVVAERLERWRQLSAGGEEKAFEDLCRTREIDDPRSWVSDVTTAPGARLPGWAGHLRAFLDMAIAGPSAADQKAVADHTATGMLFLAGTVPVPVTEGTGVDALAPAIALLRRALPGNGSPSSALVDDLCGHFASLLLTTFGDLVVRQGLPPGPDVIGGWTSLLHQYPAAGRCLGSLLEGYLGYAAELCRRLDADAEALRALARLPRDEPVRATGCRPGAGDRHDGLRSVTIVRLLGGQQVVYKPKDLRHVDALARIADAADLGLSLPARLRRKGYGWEEFIDAAAPATADECRRAAGELGAWAFFFQLLGSVDVLADNVRISADRVVPIDVEAPFRFSFVDPSGVRWLPPAATGLFSLPLLRDAASRVPDVGLMTGPGRELLEHSEDLVAGYARAAARAAGRKDAMAAEIARAGDTPVRAILRSTWIYEELLAASLRADALTGGIARDLALERLWVGHLAVGTPAALVASEVAALRRLDVPLFAYSPGGTQVRAAEPVPPGERVARAPLYEPPLTRALARVAALHDVDPAELDGLRAAMFCAAEYLRGREAGSTLAGLAAGRSGSRAARSGNAPVRRSRTASDWAERAAGVAIESAGLLRAGGPGRAPLAAGLVYADGNDAVLLTGTRPFDLFSGIAGMAVALTWLARRSGDGAVATAADAARAEAGAAAKLLADDVCRRVERGRPLRMTGAYGGMAALATLATATGTGGQELSTCAEALAGQDLGAASRQPKGAASLGGLAAALGCAATARIPGTAAARDRAAGALRCAADRLSGSARFPSGLGTLIPSERALAACAFGCLGGAVPGGAVPGAAVPGGAVPAGATVPGSGDRLVAAAFDAGHLRPVTPEVLGDLDTLHVLAELEVSLVASRRAGGFAAAAETAGGILLARHDAAHRWFGDALAPDRFRLSAVWGTIAVAHLLAGLSEPSDFSSLRLFEAVPYQP